MRTSPAPWPMQPSTRRTLQVAGAVGAAAFVAIGCAPVTTRTQVVVLPARGPPVPVSAPRGTHPVAVGYEVRYVQFLDTLEVSVVARPLCAELAFEPVRVKVDVVRTAGDALGWEWGLGALLSGVGGLGMARPQWLSTARLDAEGRVVRDRRAGYTLAGTLGSLGLLLLAAAVADTVRAWDLQRRVDGVRPREGRPVPCGFASSGPRPSHLVWVGPDGRHRAALDPGGRARLVLPPEAAFTDLPERRHRILVRLARGLGVSIPVVVPYGATARRPAVGTRRVEPIRLRPIWDLTGADREAPRVSGRAAARPRSRGAFGRRAPYRPGP